MECIRCESQITSYKQSVKYESFLDDVELFNFRSTFDEIDFIEGDNSFYTDDLELDPESDNSLSPDDIIDMASVCVPQSVSCHCVHCIFCNFYFSKKKSLYDDH